MVVTAVVLPLGLTDEAEFSDSGEIKRLMRRGYRLGVWSYLNQGHEKQELSPMGARVLHHCLSCPIRLFQLEYKSCPSFLPRTTADTLLYN